MQENAGGSSGSGRRVRRRWLAVGAVLAVVLVVAGIAAALLVNRPPQNTTATSVASAALERLRHASKVPVEMAVENGYPHAVHARVPVNGATPADRAVDYVRQFSDLYGLTDSDVGLSIRRSTSISEGGADAVALYQTYRGVPIYGAELVIPLEGAEALGSIGKLRPALGLDVKPTITADEAVQAAGSTTATPTLVVFDPTLFGLTAPGSGAPARLAWHVVTAAPEHQEVFVDAQSGQVLLRTETRPDIFSFSVTSMGEIGLMSDFNCFFPGITPDSGDSDAAVAHDRFRDTYQWYVDKFGRDSYNGLSGPVDTTVHGKFVDADGKTYLNAHYLPSCGVFEFSTGMVTDDIVTHEFTHAVTRFRSGLKYFGYPGALNESYSDIMAFLQTGDPLLGEASAKGAIRDVSKPKRDDAGDFTYGDIGPDFQYEDNGGVHSNSGITNGIAWKITRDPVTGIGDERAAQLYYAALALHPPSADFDNHRFALETAAVMLGFSSGEVCNIGREFTNALIGFNRASCDGQFADKDADADGETDIYDNCPTTPNPLQEDLDKDNKGDVCDDDDDGDGVPEAGPSGVRDNCPTVANADQKDFNANGIGAACDASEDGDIDNDLVPDNIDNCPHDFNLRPQPDTDNDGEGDACDPDLDADGISTNDDNCPDVSNANQADGDSDGVGDACDPCPSAADSGVTWSTITYFTKDGKVVTDVIPVFADSDGDGTPDSCDRQTAGVRGGSVVAADGGPVAVTPGDTDLVVSGGKGDEIAIVIAICELICPPQPAPDACTDVRVDLTTKDVVPIVRDSSGGTVSRLGSQDGARLAPDGGTTYQLLLGLTGDVSEAPLKISVGRCGDGSPSPTPTPAPTSTVLPPVTAPGGGQITLDQGGATRALAASCEVGQYPADMGGGYAFSIQGTANGGADYIALLIDLATPADIDGTHTGADSIGTTRFADGTGYNMSGLNITVRDNGTAGSYTAKAGFGGADISGTFACPGLVLPN